MNLLDVISLVKIAKIKRVLVLIVCFTVVLELQAQDDLTADFYSQLEFT